MQKSKIEWTDYEIGYIAGITVGDGTIRTKKPGVNYNKYQYYWRLALKNTKILSRVQKYLEIIQIDLDVRKFSTKEMYKLETRKQFEVGRIQTCITEGDFGTPSKEYKRGFIAGIYDAEGSHHKANLRIYNYDEILKSKIIIFARNFRFDFYKENYPSKKGNGIRLRGDKKEKERFFTVFNPIKESYFATHKN